MSHSPNTIGEPTVQADSARKPASWKETHETYLLSDHWKDLRLRCFKKSKFKCEACESKHDLQGHHLLYRTPLESCTENDVMTLCSKCHELWHKWLWCEKLELKNFDRELTKAKLKQFNGPQQGCQESPTKGMLPAHARFYENALRTAPKSGPIQMHNYAIKKTEKRFGVKLKHLKRANNKRANSQSVKAVDMPIRNPENRISLAQTITVLERVVFDQAKTIMELRLRIEALEQKVSGFAPF